MALTREAVAESTSKKLTAAAGTLGQTHALIGLDGFVDEIIAVVDKRQSLSEYEPVKTIAQLGQKILKAAGQSSNYELVVKQTKLGGNGPIMANALAAIGAKVTYIGSLGYPAMHPVFQEMAGRANVISVSEAGHTDALEFEDGKLMLGKTTMLNDVSWETINKIVGPEKFLAMVDQSALFGFVNWTMLPHMSDIWEKLRTLVLPKVTKRRRKFFVDLADPEKRTREDIRAALEILTKFQSDVDVILGLNLKESSEISATLGLPAAKNPEEEIEQTAAKIREKLGLYCCVVHPRSGAAASIGNATGRIAGPFVLQPRISTGAGDHFNAGFSLGQTLGFTLEESLCVGVGTSGYYVRTGISPSAGQLAEFIGKLPPPQS